MGSLKKVVGVVIIAAICLFGYSQYALASQIDVIIAKGQSDKGTGPNYNLQLKFDNPSLLTFTTGKTEFTITADEQKIGEGTLEPFVLPSMNSVSVQGTFIPNIQDNYNNIQEFKINGVTKYDVLLASIDVPFVYYPTAQQVKAFIHQ